MISIHFVGDGPRDVETIPHLMANILGQPVTIKTVRGQKVDYHWARLNDAKSGYARKLLFAIRVAKDIRADGLVAVVDRDKAANRARLTELKEARAKDREKYTPFPTALGEATPHGDAWMLDDPVAVRTALGLENDALIVSIRRADSPKETLDALMGTRFTDSASIMLALSQIAQLVDATRCVHRKDTGFQDFIEDVHAEFGQLKTS